MPFSRRFAGALCLGVAATCSLPARAQEEGPEYVVKEVGDAEKKDVVEWRVDTGSTFNLNDNRSVIGQTNGSSWNFGYKLDSNVDVHEAGHEWRNSLMFAAALSKTPEVAEMTKSRDDGRFETIYLYHIVDWFGPFVRFVAETSAFQGADVRGTPTVYQIAFLDGTTRSTIPLRRLHLTDAFRPTRLKESVGAFVQPVRESFAHLELRAGLGGKEIFANDQFAVADDAGSVDIIEVKELENVNQLGFEGVVEFKGEAAEKKVSYGAGAEVLVPFVHNDLPPGDDRGVGALTNWTFTAKVSFKLVEWASLDYDLSAVREPQLLDAWQVRNNLAITFSVTAGNKKKEDEAAK